VTNPDVSAPRKPIPWPAIIFLVGLLMGLVMVFGAFRAQSFVNARFDPYDFEKMGKSIARGEGFLPYGTLLKRRAPLYPLAIGGLYAAFGERPILIQLLQCLCLAGTCLLVFDLGRRLFNKRTGILAGLACAVHPMMLRYVADIQLETMFTFLTTLMVWTTVRFKEKPTVAAGLLVGAAAAVATLTKAVFLLYPGLFAAAIVLLALLARRRGQQAAIPWVPLGAMFLAMAVVISPWTIRNYKVTGHFVPVSSGASDAFLRGFIFSKTEYATLQKPPYTDAENETNAYFASLCQAAGTVCEREDWETDQVLNKAAKEKLKAEPGLFVRKFFVGMFTFWYELTSLKNSLIAGGLAAMAWALAIIGWRRGRREGRTVWPVVLPVLYLNVLLALLLALGRYSAPVLPSLLVVAAYGVDALLARRQAAAQAAPASAA
jgi:4-amino-4-deoxy-L-arabinose transferase-like glycosyltransferase